MSHPRVEEVSDSDPDAASDPDEGDIDDFIDSDIIRRVPAPSSSQQQQQQQQQQHHHPPPQPPPPSSSSFSSSRPAVDRSMYKDFQCLYPVYFDATRSRSEGRRIPCSLAVKNPLAREIATACSRLRLATLLEPEKTHPKDWANPGRVKVGLNKGPSVLVKNKHHLYILVAKHLQQNPTHDGSPGLRSNNNPMMMMMGDGEDNKNDAAKPYPRIAVPRGCKMGELVPYLSPAMTGGGVSENLLKDMMREMQGGGDPMSAFMADPAAAAAGSSSPTSSSQGTNKKKKEKKVKGRA